MPWWSWILIWVMLVLILALVLVLGAIYLWRRLRALLTELTSAQEELARSYGEGDGAPVAATRTGTEGLPVGLDAVFADPVVVREIGDEHRVARKADRRTRRIASLYAQGRPRRWGDVEHAGVEDPGAGAEAQAGPSA